MKLKVLRKYVLLTIAVFLLLAFPVYSSVSLYLRAGPGTAYPIVTRISENSPVEILGCIDGWTWCDVAWDGSRGWVLGSYLRDEQDLETADFAPLIGLPIVSFEERDYWDRHYYDRPFYWNRNLRGGRGNEEFHQRNQQNQHGDDHHLDNGHHDEHH
jgi:uncharacterized protein YraI